MPCHYGKGIVQTNTIKTIAEILSLSPGTVSIVLNGRGDEMRIAKHTQARVLEEAKLLGYQPNIYARRLRKRSPEDMTAIIGVLWPSQYSSELLVRFFDGIQKSILDDKVNVEVVYKPYQYGEVYTISDIFRNNLFNGVIVVGASDRDVEFIQSKNCTMPIIFFNRDIDKFSSVCVDEYNIGSKVAELFHARGHKDVGLVESDLMVSLHVLRKSGFMDACQRYGLTIRPENAMTCGRTPEDGSRAARRFLQSALPTAIFFALGSAVPGAYTVFGESGVRIPDDVELVGYGDTVVNQLLRPSLTVIDLPVQKIVRKCMELILDMISGKLQRHVTVYEETGFIFRESCGGFPPV